MVTEVYLGKVVCKYLEKKMILKGYYAYALPCVSLMLTVVRDRRAVSAEVCDLCDWSCVADVRVTNGLDPS